MPPSSAPPATGKRERLGFFLLTLVISLHFALSYLRLTTLLFTLDTYMTLQVETPFRYRVLPALLYKAFIYVTGHLHIHFPNLNPPVNTPENWFMVLLVTASLMGSVYFTARAIERVTGSSRYLWLSLAQILCCYFDFTLVLNRNLFYPYDLPAVFFFSALTYFAITGNYWLFALTFIPAEINKETVVMAILLFFLLQTRKDNWGRVFAYCALLTAIFAGEKYLLYRALYTPCAHCFTVGLNQLHTNLVELRNPLFLISILSLFAYLWVGLIFFWPWISRRLKYAFCITGAVWALLMLRAGILREIRIFSELSTLVIVLIAYGLHQRIGAGPAEAES